MTNRYQPAGGEHRPMVPDPAHYGVRGCQTGRSRPFSQWFRGHPSSRFQRRPPIRRRDHPYHPRDVYDFSERDWRRDKHANSRNYSGRHLHNYDYYRQKPVERDGHTGMIKLPGHERVRGNQWHQVYGPQRNQCLPYQPRKEENLAEIDFSADDTAWESLKKDHAVTTGANRETGAGLCISRVPNSRTSLPTSRHANRNDSQKHYQTDQSNRVKLASNCGQTENCSSTKDAIDSVKHGFSAESNCVQNFSAKRNGVGEGVADDSRIASETPTFSTNSGKEKNRDFDEEREHISSVTTENLEAPKTSDSSGESVLESVKCVLSKKPFVKLTRLSTDQLLKYSLFSPSSNSMGISSAQTVPKSGIPKKNTALKEGTDAVSEVNSKHTSVLPRNEVPHDSHTIKTNSCVVTEQDPVSSSSLTVDPKVMPMSLVLHTTPGAERAEDKVFTAVKPRTSFSDKGPVKKPHVGQVDFNKLKERFWEAMASRKSHIMKKFSAHATKNEIKHPQADLFSEPPNVDRDGSGSEPKTDSDDHLPSLEPQCENVNKDITLPIPELTSESEPVSGQPSDSQNANAAETPSIEPAREEMKRRSESITVSLEDACKACEALVDYVPKVVVLDGAGVNVVSVSREDSVADGTAEDKIGDNCANSSPHIIPSAGSASNCDQKAGQHINTAETKIVSPNLDPAMEEILEQSDTKGFNISGLATENVGSVIEGKADSIPDTEDSGLATNTSSAEKNADSAAPDKTTSEQMNVTLNADCNTAEEKQGTEDISRGSSDNFRDSEGEQSAVDAAEGLLCLAKSGAKIFRSQEGSATKSTQQSVFNPEADSRVSDVPVRQTQESSAVLANSVDNPESVQQCSENSRNLLEMGLSENKTQVTSSSLKGTLSSTSLVVTQPSALPLAQTSAPSEKPGSIPVPQNAAPPPTFLVLGPLQLTKNVKVKQPRLKVKRDNVLRPLLPKTNGNDIVPRTETDTVMPPGNGTVAVSKPDPTVESETDLLDLSVKTKKSPSADWKPDPDQAENSEPEKDADTELCNLATQYQSSQQTGDSQSTSPGSLLQKNCTYTDPANSVSPILTEVTPEPVQQEGEISKHRLKVLISNLRENLGKKGPLHPMSLPVPSLIDGRSPVDEGAAEEAGSVNNHTLKRERNAKRATKSVAQDRKSVKKVKARKCDGKRKGSRRNLKGRTQSNAATTKTPISRRRAPKTNVVVKDFYTRLRAKTEGRLNRGQLAGRKPSRRQSKDSKASSVKENEAEFLDGQMCEASNMFASTAIVDVTCTDTPDKFEEGARLVIDNVPESVEPTDQHPQPEDPSVAVDMTVQCKPKAPKQRKLDRRRKKKGRRNHCLRTFEEYKKKLGCEDTDDLPTILPPKRRRTQTKTLQPPKKTMEDPLDGNISRLAREFPRHNWLENKIKNIAAGQKAPSDTNSSPSPVPTTAPKPSLPLAPVAGAESTLKVIDDCPPPLTPINSDDQANGSFPDSPGTDATGVKLSVTEEQMSKSNEQERKSRNGEESVSVSGEKNRLAITVDAAVHNGMVENENDLSGEICRAKANGDAENLSMGQNEEVSGACQREIPAASGNSDSLLGTGNVDETLRCETRKSPDVSKDLTASAPVNKTDGSHSQADLDGKCLQTEKNVLLSDGAFTTQDTAADICSEGESKTHTQPPGTDEREVPLNLSVKPLASAPTDSPCQEEKATPVDMSSSNQLQNTESSAPLAYTLKNGPPVLKVLPQVKQMVSTSPEEFVSFVKESVRCSVEVTQPLSTPQALSPQGTPNEGRSRRGRGPVPPVPALVPLSGVSSKWTTSEQCTSQDSRLEPSVGMQGNWAERLSGNSGESGIVSMMSADSVMASSGAGSTRMDSGLPKRSSFESGAGQSPSGPSLQQSRCSSLPSAELQVLIKEFKALEKKVEDMEKELNITKSLQKQKKEELVHFMRHRLGVSRNKDSQYREVSMQLGEHFLDPDWREVRAPVSSPAESSDSIFNSANKNNNNSSNNNIPCSIHTPLSDRLRSSSSDLNSFAPSDSAKDTRTANGVSRPSSKRHRSSAGIDLSAKRRLASGQANPPQAHSNSTVDSVWTMMDIPVIQPTSTSRVNCPYVQNSTTHDVPEFSNASDQSLKAHPAHSQKPFETAGVIITAQNEDSVIRGRSQRTRATHNSSREKSHSKPVTVQQTNGASYPSQVNETNPKRPTGALQDRSSQWYNSGPPPLGQADACHMKLPVASPTKISPSLEQPNTANMGHSEPRRTMLEYVDLRKSPENIVRRVHLPPGLHFGPYPSERFPQAAPVRAHSLPTPVHQNQQAPQHTASVASEKEQNVQRELAATVEKQRRSKLHDNDPVQPRMGPWPAAAHPAVLQRRPDGAAYYPQNTTSGVMVPHTSIPLPVTLQEQSQSSGSMIYTMSPYPAQSQMRPAKPVSSGNQTSLNTANPFQDKPQFVPSGQNEHIPAHGQFLTHQRGPPMHFAHSSSAESVITGRGGLPASTTGQHPRQLVQALGRPPLRHRVPHFMPPPQRMSDPRGIGRGQTFFKVPDAHNPPMKPPSVTNPYRPEGPYHPQRYPHHDVPIPQFVVPNSPTVHIRMPSSSNPEIRGKFVELSHRISEERSPGGYLPGQHLNDRSEIHASSAGPQPHASARPTNQSPQQQHPRQVNHSPSQQGAVQQSPVNHSHLPQEHALQSMTHHPTGHHSSLHQSPIPQSSVHQIAAHPFADRQPTNPQFVSRSQGHVSSQQKIGSEGGSRSRSSGSRPTDFTCAECNGKANMICSRCESVRYCSRDCQIKGWLEHGQHCKPRTSTR